MFGGRQSGVTTSFITPTGADLRRGGNAMKMPNRLEVKIVAAGMTEPDCANCKVPSCHWDDEYGCAIAWYNVWRITAEGTEQPLQPDNAVAFCRSN